MPGSTRRTFLIAGGATGVTAALSGTAAAATPADRAPSGPDPDAQSMIAHIDDPSTGRVSLFVGEEQIDVVDPELVARITRAAKRKV